MAKIADADKMRAGKLDSAWVKAVWVGRVGKSSEHRLYQTTRKSTSGAVIMAEGMRLHARSRGQSSVALSRCEAEVIAASESIKEALLMQEMLMFAVLGPYMIEVKVDNCSAAHVFFPSTRELNS